MALRDDVERVRERPGRLGHRRQRHARRRRLRVRTRGPARGRPAAPAGRQQGRARPHRVRRAARDAGHRRELDGAAHQPPRRAAVLRPGRRARGDRPARRRRPLRSTSKGGWSQSNYQRSVEQGGLRPPRRTPPTSRSTLYKKRGADRVLVGVPAELHAEFKGKLHPYLIERIAGKISVDVENASLDDVCAAARPEITAHVMRCEREALDRLAGRASARGGRGAAGIAEVLDALNQARVETLLIAENFQAPAASTSRPGCCCPRAATTGEPVDDIVEPAIEKAIEQSANAMVVRHHDDLDRSAASGRCCGFETSRSSARASWARRWRATSRPRGMRSVPGTGPRPRPRGSAPPSAAHPGRGGRGAEVDHHDARRRADRRGRDGRRHAGRRRQSGGRRAPSASSGSTKFGAPHVDGPVMGTTPARRGGQAHRAGVRARARAAGRDLRRRSSAKVIDLGEEIGAGQRMKLVGNSWVLGAGRGAGGDDRARRAASAWTRRTSWR